MAYVMYLAALALIAAGLAGTVIPAIPGLPLIFAGAWLIGWASHYELISVIGVVVLALLAAVGVGIDMLAQIMGAKKAGASKAGLWGAAIGTALGLVTGIAGLVFLPLLGAVAGEIIAGRDLLKAGAIGLATWIGMAVGLGVKVALAFTMTGFILFSVVSHSAISSFFGGGSEAAENADSAVPQAPVDAAPIVGHPGKPEPGRYAARRGSSDDSSSEAAASEASEGAPQAQPEPQAAAPSPAQPEPEAQKPAAASQAEPASEASPAPQRF